MTLYIKLNESNEPQNFPLGEENLKYLFPAHDFTSGAPSGYAVFVKTESPAIGPYEKLDASYNPEGIEYRYEADGTVKEYWHVLNMTDEEKKAKQDKVKEDWAKGTFDSWIFNEANCTFDAPVELPTDATEKIYKWDEDTVSWVEK